MDSVFPVYRVGIVLSVPLWDGGRLRTSARRPSSMGSARAEARSLLKAGRDEQERTAAEFAGQVSGSTSAAPPEARARRPRSSAGALSIGAADLRALFDAYDRLAHAEDRELSAKADRVRAALHANP